MSNIILIGMPGAGKSTVGVILAKVLGLNFIDSDLIIQEEEGKLLRDIIAQEGLNGYIEIENRVNKNITVENTVISTGGSAIYGKEAMKNFRNEGIVVYLKLDYKTISKRLGDIKARGVVLRDGQSLKDLYHERTILYEKYAHITLDMEGHSIEESMEAIVEAVKEKRNP